MLDHLSSVLLRTSFEAGIVIGVLWIVCRALPQLPAGVRATLWWLAAAKLVVGCLWPVPIELPVLPASTVAAPAVEAAATTGVRAPAMPNAMRANAPRVDGAVRPMRAGADVSSTARVVAGLWLLAMAVFVVSLARQWRHTRRIVGRARAAPPGVLQRAAAAAARMHVGPPADVRESVDVETPQVTGMRRPIVLVPAAFRTLSHAEQQMVLCHEMAHVRRRDLWMGAVPALAQRLFFFHPLAYLAAREYHVAREAACDAEVLVAMDVPPRDYGRLLLTLGVTRSNAIAAATASRSHAMLKRRLSMLSTHTSPRLAWRIGGWLAAALTICSVLPIALVAAPAEPAPEPTTLAKTVAPATATAPAPAPEAIDAAPVRGPVLPAPAQTPLLPALAQDARTKHSGSQDQDEPWVFFKAGDHGSSSGSGVHRAAAERHRRGSEALLWFERDGKEFVVRNPVLLQRVEAAIAPLAALGGEMGALGGRQGALGLRQGGLGARQGALGSRQGELGARQGELGSRQAALQKKLGHHQMSEQERAALQKDAAAIEAEMEQVAREMEALGREMETLAEPMEDLGRQMEDQGRQMEALGKKMEAAGKQAAADIRQLMDEAVRSGQAQQVP